MTLIAIVGMTGSGKTLATDFFVSRKFTRVYFGGIVLEETKKKGLALTEENESKVREELRQLHGMAAMALLSIPKIEKLVSGGKKIVIDGLYSWQELIALKQKFPGLITVAIFTSPKERYKRLAHRKERPLTETECISRDRVEIENLAKGGPIAVADHTIINEGTKKEFENALEKLFEKLSG